MNTATVNKEHTTKKMSTRQMTFIALMTAVTCILGPLSIPLPFSPVPISFTNLAIYLSLYVLGLNGATISYLVYLLIGMVGVPVFSGFSGGFGKLAGPTGGYLIGFIFLTLIAGLLMKLFPGNKVMEAVGTGIRNSSLLCIWNSMVVLPGTYECSSWSCGRSDSVYSRRFS